MPAESRNAVLCHELAHIQDCDFFLRGLAEIARSLIWFQPLMWIALRQLREEQELACDNRVLAVGGKASAYARLLLEWYVRSGTGSLTAVGMAHRSCLKRRLYALLDQDLRRDRVAGTSVVAIWFLGLAAALPLAAVSLTSATDVPPTVLHPLPQAQVERAPVAKAERAPAVLPPHTRQVRLAQVLPAAVPAQTPSTQPAGTNVRAVSTPLPRFVSATSLVMVDVTVEDTNGKAIEGLSAGSFVLTEDGKAQTVSVFEFQKVDDAAKNISGYYVLGYYSTGDRADGRYRRIGIALAGDTMAKLDYRAGHYADKSFSGASDNNIGAHFTVDDVADIAGGSKTMPPAVILKRDPEYSEQARKAKYSGTVALLVDIGASGKVTSVTVIRSLGMGLDEKAIEAITQWKFRPSMKDGKPVSTQVQVNLIFRLL